jgi:hypothetical protein
VRQGFRASKRLAIVADLHRTRRMKIQETAAAQGFPAILTNAGLGRSGVSRIAISTHCIVIAGDLRARSHRCVNTSLSGTLFFSMCWCIRDDVHLDSRVHAAN